MFTIYKIYYDEILIYIGRTQQKLQTRLHGHFFKAPMMREIDINGVTKIEFTKFETQADMFVWEIYLINKYKPPLNKDDKAKDNLTFDLIEPEFKKFYYYKISEWRDKINLKDKEYEKKKQEKIMLAEVFREQRKIKIETLPHEEYLEWLDNQKSNINYQSAKNGW